MITDTPNGKEYSSLPGRFKVVFPDVPQEFEAPTTTKAGTTILHTVLLASTITHMLTYFEQLAFKFIDSFDLIS